MVKRFFALAGTLVLIGGGCLSENPSATQITAQEAADEQAPSTEGQGDDGDIGADLEAATLVGTSATIETGDPVLLPREVSMEAGNFFYEGETIAAQPGQSITVVFTHVDGGHTFVVDELDLRETVTANGSVTFVAPMTPGEYPYYCDVGGHRKLGMEGKLIVE